MFTLFLIAVVGVVLLAAVVFMSECLLARAPQRRLADSEPGPRARFTVVVPAHDEEQGITATLESIRAQTTSSDAVLVVADNCRDETARVAREAGAEVVVRFEPERRGKGYALAAALAHLESDPPDVVVVVDADCRVEGSLAQLASEALRTGAPCQAAYRIEAPPGASPGSRVSAFAVRVKNWVRPLGLHRLRLPCSLQGSGMALPWQILAGMPMGAGEIVEDLRLGIALTIRGHPPRFVPEVRVTSWLPRATGASLEQRRRWEHGHLATQGRELPRLLVAAFRQRRLAPFAVALDLLVPPIALLTLVAAGLFVVATGLVVSGGSGAPVAGIVLALLAIAVGTFVAWRRHGRDLLDAADWLRMPAYAFSKLPMYLGFFVRRQVDWIRTERGP